ncbi:hypothetical protein ACS5PN_16460 [Roseateles sp. NT4]|uniref:hypothetical protein n=1 Tax=Roseateles sp. NT4 TaxID=3453715 RepID=UPI003EEBB422
MADTFEDFVRSGRLQKNFDDAVEKAADEARQRGLHRPVEPTPAESQGDERKQRETDRDAKGGLLRDDIDGGYQAG